MRAFLFDIGGTNTRIAVSDRSGSLGKIKTFATPQDYSQGIETLVKEASGLLESNQVDIVFGGVPGPLNKEKESLIGAPNLPGWSNKPLKKNLESVFKTKVFLENDAALAGVGEAVWGAGKGFSIVAYLTVSTGVGGARIVNGKIDNNALGFEPGHQIIDKFTTLEDLVSGKALEKRFSQKPEEIAKEEVWEEVARYLAIGVNNIIVTWSPEVVILGGAVMNKISLGKIRFYLGQFLKIFSQYPAVTTTSLKGLGGLYGALALSFGS